MPPMQYKLCVEVSYEGSEAAVLAVTKESGNVRLGEMQLKDGFNTISLSLIHILRKDLRGRYKGSVLGFFWTFLNPLLQLLVYTMVFSVIMPVSYTHLRDRGHQSGTGSHSASLSDGRVEAA